MPVSPRPPTDSYQPDRFALAMIVCWAAMLAGAIAYVAA